jgi:hypothetical protein
VTTPNQQLPEPPDFASPIAAEERDGYRALDALGPGWIAVLSGSTAAPVADAPQGARYLVPLTGSGAWATHARHIAYMTPDGWAYRAPRRGWVALVLDEGTAGRVYVYDGTDWIRMGSDAFDLADLDALDVTFSGYGLPGDPLTVDAALDALYAFEEDHETRITALEASAGGGGGSGDANVTPDTHPAIVNAADDEFETGTNIDTGGTRFTGATAWAWRNQGGATDAVNRGSLVITAPSSSGIAWRIVEQAVPAGAWRFRAKVSANLPQTNFCRASLLVYRTTSSKLLSVDSAYSSGQKIEANAWNINGPYIGAIGGSANFPGNQNYPIYLEIEYDGSSIYTFRHSIQGIDGTFTTIGTEAAATNLGGAADKIALGVNTESSAGQALGIFDWFRRMA